MLGCGSKEYKIQKCNKNNICNKPCKVQNQRRRNERNNGGIWGGEKLKTKISSE